MTVKEKHKNLKKKVNLAEEKRRIRRGQKSWYELRTLKKLKLKMKDLLAEKKSWVGMEEVFCCPVLWTLRNFLNEIIYGIL